MKSDEIVSSVIREAKTHPNMILISSQTKPENLLRAMTAVVTDELSESDRSLIMGSNLLRTLGIDD